MSPEQEKPFRQVVYVIAHVVGADYDTLARVERVGYQPGSFIEALLRAWLRADARNWRRLDRAFPEYAGPMAMYRDGSLADLLAFCEDGFGNQGSGT